MKNEINYLMKYYANTMNYTIKKKGSRKKDQEKSSATKKLVWCVCHNEEHGRMILYDNKTCKIGWFPENHLDCGIVKTASHRQLHS